MTDILQSNDPNPLRRVVYGLQSRAKGTITSFGGKATKWRDYPMLRHIADPVDAGGLEAHVWIEATGHGPMDDHLLLLVQQLDQPPLGADEAIDAVVEVGKEANDAILLFPGRYLDRNRSEVGRVKPIKSTSDSLRSLCE